MPTEIKFSQFPEEGSLAPSDYVTGYRPGDPNQNKRWGLDAVRSAVLRNFNLVVYEVIWPANSIPQVDLAAGDGSLMSVWGFETDEFLIEHLIPIPVFPIYVALSSQHQQLFSAIDVAGKDLRFVKSVSAQMFGYLLIFSAPIV